MTARRSCTRGTLSLLARYLSRFDAGSDNKTLAYRPAYSVIHTGRALLVVCIYLLSRALPS